MNALLVLQSQQSIRRMNLFHLVDVSTTRPPAQPTRNIQSITRISTQIFVNPIESMRRGHDEPQSQDVLVEVTSSFGEEKLVRSHMKGHQQKAMIQGRPWYNSKLKQVRTIPPSKLSRCDHSERIVIDNIKKSKSTNMGLATRMVKWSWLEDFPGARMGVALKAALLFMIAATFAVSVYIHHEGLKTQLKAHFDGKSHSCVCPSRSMMASFPYDESSLLSQRLPSLAVTGERSEGQQIFEIVTMGEIPGC